MLVDRYRALLFGFEGHRAYRLVEGALDHLPESYLPQKVTLKDKTTLLLHTFNTLVKTEVICELGFTDSGNLIYKLHSKYKWADWFFNLYLRLKYKLKGYRM